MTKLGLCLSSGPPPLDDKRVRITKFCLRMSYDLRVSMTDLVSAEDDVNLRVSSGPPPLDDTRVQNDQIWSPLVIGPAASG